MRGREPLQSLDELIDDRPGDGVFRIHRAMFDDPAIFELEMRHIFEGGWVFLGLESQAAGPHDYFTVNIGRVPALVMRGGDGMLRVFRDDAPLDGCCWPYDQIKDAAATFHRLAAQGRQDN